MINCKEFKEWLNDNTEYCPDVVCDNVSRMKRADSIREWDGNETYLYYLEKEPKFEELSVSVRSQLRKATKLYAAYYNAIVKAQQEEQLKGNG